jgi:hypothetical protein
MSNILGQGGGGLHLNGSYFLNSGTVEDDHSVDVLCGRLGRDWYFADVAPQTGPRDVILGSRNGDTVTNV